MCARYSSYVLYSSEGTHRLVIFYSWQRFRAGVAVKNEAKKRSRNGATNRAFHSIQERSAGIPRDASAAWRRKDASWRITRGRAFHCGESLHLSNIAFPYRPAIRGVLAKKHAGRLHCMRRCTSFYVVFGRTRLRSGGTAILRLSPYFVHCNEKTRKVD